MAKKSTDALIDLASDLMGGKGVDLGDIADLGGSLLDSTSKKKKSSGSKKKSPLDTILDLVDGGTEYPTLNQKNYKTIRGKWQKNMPEKVTSATLASQLDIKKSTVESSIIPDLKALGLINSKGTIQPLAKRWADDEKHAEACKEILEEVYPNAVRRLAWKTKTDQRDVLSWFKKNTDVSETVEKKMVATYVLLRTNASGDVAASTSKSKSGSSGKSANVKDADTDVSVDKLKNGTVKIKILISVPEDTTEKELTSLLSAANKKVLAKY